jgi:hypothetical protein
VKYPGVSSDDAIAITPYRLFLPYPGFHPTIPHILAGCLIDPHVSVPSAAGTSHAATATADPDEEPPGMRLGSHGFRAGPKALFSPLPHIAYSSILVFQKETPPDFFIRSVTVDSYGGTKFSSIFELAVVGIPFSQNISLTAIGSPLSVHIFSTYKSEGRVLKALSSVLYFLVRSRKYAYIA